MFVKAGYVKNVVIKITEDDIINWECNEVSLVGDSIKNIEPYIEDNSEYMI